MITLFGYSLQAIYPLSMLGIPMGTAFLVYVYRSLGDTQKTVISSLFLLRDLPRASPGRKKFIPPFQFWVELLCLLALALAAAGITARREGEHIAIVIDSSLSMTAAHTTGQNRLQLAKQQALTHLSQAPSYHRFSVFEAGGTARRISAPETSAFEASQAIEKIAYSVEQDRLSPILESLFSSGEFDGVWLYTDHLLTKTDSTTAGPVLRITSLPSTNERQTGVNLWVSDIVERREGGTSTLTVTIQGTAPSPITATVSVACYRNSLSDQVGQPLSQQVGIPHANPVTVTVDSIPKGWRFCKITVLPSAASIQDAIPDDNVAWITHAATQHEFILQSPLTANQLGLDKLQTPRVVQGSDTGKIPAEARNLPTIFHRKELPRSAPPPSFAVLPPPGSFPWGGGISEAEIKSAEITRWSNSHPLLQYLNVPTLVLPSARVVTCPATATPILFTREGSIGCAGESPTGRFVILGFEVFPFDGARSPAASILVLNIFKWLLQDLALDNRPRAPGYQLLPAGSVKATNLVTSQVVSEFDESRRLLLTGSSLIEFSDQDGVSTGQAASLFSSPYESDIRNEHQLLVTTTSDKVKDKGETSLPLWHYLALAALLFLAWDLLRKLRGSSRWEVT